jgi:hypothetical protein
MDIKDIRVQDGLRRDLESKLMMAVFDAIEGGLNADNAQKAVQSLWDQDQRLGRERQVAARSYI